MKSSFVTRLFLSLLGVIVAVAPAQASGDRGVKHYDVLLQVTAQRNSDADVSPGFIELSLGTDADGKMVEIFSEEVKDPAHRANSGQVFPLNADFRTKGIVLQKVSAKTLLGRVSRNLLILTADRSFSMTSGGAVSLTFKSNVLTGSSEDRRYTLDKNAAGKWELRKNGKMFNKIHIVGGSTGIDSLSERTGKLR